MLSNLWDSVSRAGPAFRKSGAFNEHDGEYRCLFYLEGQLAPAVTKALKAYMRSYAHASGWQVRSLKFSKTQASLVIASSSAVSKAAKKP